MLLPLASYWVVKNYTENNVNIPRKYFHDRVKTDTVNGKIVSDTVWHQVKNLSLVNQFGDTVNLNQLSGKVLMVNFFFTHCPTICPTITTNLRKVQKTLANDTAVQIVSISLDPKRDSTQRLFKYANQYGIKHDNWWLGSLVNDSLEQVMLKEFKAAYVREDGNIELDHTTNVYLLDKNRIVRKFYDGMDSTELFYMINDAGLVKMERTTRNKPPFAILIASTIIMGAVFIFIFMRQKNKKKYATT
jgi:protein SCO1